MKDIRGSYWFVPHNVVAPSRSAWSTSRMEMCSQAEQLTHNVGVVDALDDDVKHMTTSFHFLLRGITCPKDWEFGLIPK
jgi:hypothetical protein